MFLRAFIAMLVLLIGGALVWAVTTGSDGRGPQRATSPEERKAVRTERRLAAAPADRSLLRATMSSWLAAGADRLSEIDTRRQPIPEAVVEDYEAGLRAWDRLLRQTRGEVDADVAASAATAFFELVEIGSSDPAVATAHAAGAVRAQKIVCKRNPNALTLSNLASYHYFNGEFAAGDRTTERTLRHTQGLRSVRGSTRYVYWKVLEGYRERGQKFVARVTTGLRTLRETGEEELPEPIKGYGAPAGINGYEPGAGPT